jgi:cell division protein FtsB
LLLLLVCIFFVSSYMSRLRDLAALDAEFAAEKVRIEQAKVQQDLLALEADRAQGEDTVDRAARRDLDLVLPGDQPYAVIQPAAISVTQPATLSATVAASPSTSLAPRSAATAIWRQWLELFR